MRVRLQLLGSDTDSRLDGGVHQSVNLLHENAKRTNQARYDIIPPAHAHSRIFTHTHADCTCLNRWGTQPPISYHLQPCELARAAVLAECASHLTPSQLSLQKAYLKAQSYPSSLSRLTDSLQFEPTDNKNGSSRYYSCIESLLRTFQMHSSPKIIARSGLAECRCQICTFSTVCLL